MLIQSESYSNIFEIPKKDEEKEQLQISKDLLNEAKKHSQKQNYVGVIYGTNTISISSSNITNLTNHFKGDFSKYEDILIAKGEGKEYLEKITSFVLKDLNVKNADENNDGNISVAESLNTKRTFDEVLSILRKPIDTLPIEVIELIKKDHSNFMSINNIINENIKVDENKDGEVSLEEIGIHLENTQEEEVVGQKAKDMSKINELLEKLNKQLKEIKKKMEGIIAKLVNADEDKAMLLNDQLLVLQAQEVKIMVQIQEILKKLLES